MITGKEAMNAALDGKKVEFKTKNVSWVDFNKAEWAVDDLLDPRYIFRIKPRTITINGIEVPAPFKPKDGDKCYIVDTEQEGCFYEFTYKTGYESLERYIRLGAWRTEDEIKQVVAALRSIFATA